MSSFRSYFILFTHSLSQLIAKRGKQQILILIHCRAVKSSSSTPQHRYNLSAVSAEDSSPAVSENSGVAAACSLILTASRKMLLRQRTVFLNPALSFSRGLTAAKRDVSAGLNSALAIFAPNRRYPRQKEPSHFQTRAKIPSHATAPCQA